MLRTVVAAADRLDGEAGGGVDAHRCGPPGRRTSRARSPRRPGSACGRRASSRRARAPTGTRRPAGIEEVAELVEARAQVLAGSARTGRAARRRRGRRAARLAGRRRQEAPALQVEGARARVVGRSSSPNSSTYLSVCSCVSKIRTRAQLGVAAALEALAHGLDPAARAVLCLQHDHVVAVPHEVVGGAQAGEPGAEHDDAVARRRGRACAGDAPGAADAASGDARSGRRAAAGTRAGRVAGHRRSSLCEARRGGRSCARRPRGSCGG